MSLRGLLIDTRSGYVYAAYETTKRAETLSTSWGSSDAADDARLRNEREAFEQLVGEFESAWSKLLERHGKEG